MKYKDQYVYFIKPIGCDGPIKIGVSNHVGLRLEGLANWSPVPLEIIITIPGNFILERNIQRCFADYHSHKEWFFPGERLVLAIEALKSGVPVSEAIDLADLRGDIHPAPCLRVGTEGRRSYIMRMTWAYKKLPEGTSVPIWARAPMARWNAGINSVRPTAEEFEAIERYLSDPVRHAVFYNSGKLAENGRAA